MTYQYVTEYLVGALPIQHPEFHHFAIQVAWRDVDSWAVVRWHSNLGTDGEWDYERSPSNREDEWVATHRFTLERALELAAEAAPHITVNGYTVDDVKDWAEEEE